VERELAIAALLNAMTADDFKRSLNKPHPPGALAPALQALWWVAKDDWDRAHEIVMAHEDSDCAWVHAYLHRREGDLPNARWWYRQADKAAATGSLDADWNAVVRGLLGEA
jgi:hypothetical protein